MRISELWGTANGKDVYVVGSGPSTRVFPDLRGFLADKITIGLNQAWKIAPVRYTITVHGELFLDWQKTEKRANTFWMVSTFKPPLSTTFADPRFYAFHSRNDLDVLRHPQTRDHLLVLHGIHNAAIHAAVLMGAKNVILVGCDMAVLGGDHHGHAQHVKYHERSPAEVFHDMLATSQVVRGWAREKGVRVLTLTPQLGAYREADYQWLRRELELGKLPEPEDTSQYAWYKGPQPKL